MAKFKIITSNSCGFRFAEALPQNVPITNCPKCGTSCTQGEPVELPNDVARFLVRFCEAVDWDTIGHSQIGPIDLQGEFYV